MWYNVATVAKPKQKRRVMDTSRYLDYEEAEEKPRARIVAYCDHCGYAIYSTDEALEIEGSGDIIHKDCWCEYAEEHMLDFVRKASFSAAY